MAAHQAYFPIRELSAYHSRWTIRARVTSKGQMREFAPRVPGGAPGKVFHVDLLDADNGEIRASFFGQAADAWYGQLEPGKCYTFSRGGIKVANPRFNTCRHRYEITFERDPLIEESADDAKIAAVNYSFVGLQALQSRVLPCTVDICGVIVSFRPAFGFTSRDGKELIKRELVLADNTAVTLSVTLWGDKAKQEDLLFDGNPVVCLKGVLIKEWQSGRSGSLLGGGSMELNATLPEVERQRRWWSEEGSKQSLAALSSMGGAGAGARISGAKSMTLAEVRKAADLVSSEPEIYTVVCRLAQVQMKKMGETQPLVYMACQELKQGTGFPCNKRVDESGHCSSCGRAGRAQPRLNLRCRYIDTEDSTWLTTFHEPAQNVVGMKADKAQELEQGCSRDALEAAVQRRYFHGPLQVTVKAKLDNYTGQLRTNVVCIDARPVSRREHGRVLLKEIRQMLN